MHKVDNANKSKVSPQFILSNVMGVFLSPGETFLRIKQQPHWLIPFVLVLFFSAVASYLVSSTQLKIGIEKGIERFDQTAWSEEMTHERLAAVEEKIAYLAAGTTILKKILLLLFVSGMIYFSGSLILFNDASFEQIFAVTCYSCLITAISSLVLAPVINLYEVTNLTSLGNIFFDSIDSSNFLQVLLSNSSFELFTIWTVVVLGIGVARVYGCSTRKGVTILLGLWGIQLLLRTSITVLFA